MTVKQSVRNYLKIFDDLDSKVVGTEVTGSCHYKITVTSNGNRRFFIASRSPSDPRTLSNFRAMVKRWKRTTQENIDV